MKERFFIKDYCVFTALWIHGTAWSAVSWKYNDGGYWSSDGVVEALLSKTIRFQMAKSTDTTALKILTGTGRNTSFKHVFLGKNTVCLWQEHGLFRQVESAVVGGELMWQPEKVRSLSVRLDPPWPGFAGLCFWGPSFLLVFSLILFLFRLFLSCVICTYLYHQESTWKALRNS